MAIYYVSPYGSDSNNGLSPDPTNATNKPFLTIGKALGSTVAAAGDTVYVAPGVYRVSSSISPGASGSSGSPITMTGDPGNSQGFKDSAGNILSAGEVRVTTYAINDTTIPTTAIVLSISKNYLNFSNFWFIGGTTSSSTVATIGGCHDLNFTSCMFQAGPSTNSGQQLLYVPNSTSQLAMNLTFDRCIFMPASCIAAQFLLTKTSSGSSDYNANILIQNSLFLGGTTHIQVGSAGSGTYLGGGVSVKNCTSLWPGAYSVYTSDSGVSLTYPVTVYNCIMLKTTNNSLCATTSGQLVENYNLLTGRTNVTAGANSTSDGSNCPMLDFGQWNLWGQNPRALATPTINSPQLGFGNGGTPPSYDFVVRNRPEGGLSLSNAIGYMERHDTAAKEVVTTQSGGVGTRISGPGSHEFQIPVDAIPTTISVMCNYDANHGTATPPQAILAAVPELGVTSQTVTAPAVVGQWSTLSFGTITPTVSGVVRVILLARPTAANGNAYFDTFSVS